MFRLLIWALIIYLGYRLLQSLLLPKKQSTHPNVKGKQKTKPLDLNNENIEDANYREIEDKHDINRK